MEIDPGSTTKLERIEAGEEVAKKLVVMENAPEKAVIGEGVVKFGCWLVQTASVNNSDDVLSPAALPLLYEKFW